MVIYYLFYVLIFVFTIGQLGRFELGDGIVLQISDIAVFFVISYWLIQKMINKRSIQLSQNRLYKPVLLFIFACLVSLVVNSLMLSFQQLLFSSLYLIRWVSYASLFFILESFSTQTKKKIILFLIASQIVIIFAGLVQYIFYPNLRNLYYIGWDDHLYRLFSTFLDPNFAATQLNLFMFLLLALLLSDIVFNHNYKKTLWIVFMFAFIALLLTYSRSGYLMFFVGVTVELWLLERKRLIGFFLLLLATGIFILPKDLRSAGVELWRTASISARSRSASQALTIIKDQPVFGVGFNAYRYAQIKYGFIDKKTWKSTHSGAGTDNSLLFVLATTGFVGLSTYFYLWFTVMKYSYKNYKSYKNYPPSPRLNRGSEGFRSTEEKIPRHAKRGVEFRTIQKMISIIIISSTVGLFVDSLFINALFYPYVMFWMWTLWGVSGPHGE